MFTQTRVKPLSLSLSLFLCALHDESTNTHSRHMPGERVPRIQNIWRKATLLSPNKISRPIKWGVTQESCVISLDGVSTCFKVIYITTPMIHGGGEQKWSRKRAYWLCWVSHELCPPTYSGAVSRRSAPWCKLRRSAALTPWHQRRPRVVSELFD